VVAIEPVTTMAKQFARSARQGAAPLPGPVKNLAELGHGDPVFGPEELMPAELERLPPSLQEALGRSHIPFPLARQIESELGERGYQGGALIGGMQKGQYKALRHAMGGAIDEFLQRPGQGPTAEALTAAKEAYRVGRSRFNDSVLSAIARARKPADAERVVSMVFRPGAKEDLLTFREAVSDDTWTLTRGAWLAGLIDKSTLPRTAATGEDLFSPSRFVREITPYIRSGQLEIAFGRETSEKILDLVSVFKRLGRKELLAGNPSGTGGAMISVAQLGSLVASAGLGAGVGYTDDRGPLGAAGGALMTILAPVMAGKYIYSRAGVKLLSEGLSGKYSAPATRFAIQVLGQELGR